MSPNDIISDVCARMAAAHIRCLVGGSVAAGVWGEPRQTNDVDVEVWLDDANASKFVQALPDPYHVSRREVEEALALRDEFRVIQVMHTEEVFKIDFFLQGRSPIDEEAFARAVQVELKPGSTVPVACPEHILIQKLRWYNLGNQVSERQWRDMIAIAQVSAELDWKLVERWAGLFNLGELLTELRAAAI